MKVTLTQDDGTEIDITNDMRTAYDIAVGSMDFGSGFLSTDDVTALRRVQAALNAKPLVYQDDPCEDCAHRRGDHSPHGKCYRRESPITNNTPTCECQGFTFGGETGRAW